MEPKEPSHDIPVNIHVGRHPGQQLEHSLSEPGEKENDLLKQQNVIQEKLTELAKREAEVYRVAFDKEKELTDRALKLAEVSKPKSNWELQEYWRWWLLSWDFWQQNKGGVAIPKHFLGGIDLIDKNIRS